MAATSSAFSLFPVSILSFLSDDKVSCFLFPASSQDKILTCLRLGALVIIQSLLGLPLIVFA